MFQINTALTALNSTANTQMLVPILNNLRVHITNRAVISTKEAVLLEVEVLRPSLLFLSTSLPGMIKIEDVISKVKQLSPRTKIVLVANDSDSNKVLDYFLLSVETIVFAKNIYDCLEFSVKQALKGFPYLCPSAINGLKDSLKTDEVNEDSNYGLLYALTEREAEVLHSLTQGANYKQISKLLFISESTVKTHINNIFTKLSVNDRTQAVLYALKHGIERLVKNPSAITNITAETIEHFK